MKSRSPSIVIVLLASMAALQAAEKSAKFEKPNILYILADDMGSADAGFNGGKDIRTPNLDQLARGGAILKSFYVQPVCSPTRSTLMTGRYPFRTGVYSVVRPNAPWGLKLEDRTLAQALREAGYETAIDGKWHLGNIAIKTGRKLKWDPEAEKFVGDDGAQAMCEVRLMRKPWSLVRGVGECFGDSTFHWSYWWTMQR